MHTQVASLIVGGICTLLTAWTCYYFTADPVMFALAATLTGITIFRIVFGFVHRNNREFDGKNWTYDFYPLVSFAFAACIGLMASTAIAVNAPAAVQVLAVTYGMTYASGISIRSAGRPVIALGQLAITTIPIMVALITTGHFAGIVLALIVPGLVAGMAATTIKLFKTMTQQANMAEDYRKMADLVERQAQEDSLTGLLNRAGLDKALAEFANTLPEGKQLALIWLDLHRFKDVNDTLGHTVGDLMLKEMGRRLVEELPDNAVVARFGSDEFVLGTIVNDRRVAEQLCQSISERLAVPARLAGHRVEAGTALGAALLPEDAPTIDKLMQAADIALFNAKIGGRQKIRFFDETMTRALARRKEMEKELRNAIQKDELSVFFQPIVDLETGKIRCFEALLRWFHPEKGELRPDEFVPIAEETGLIITLGNWVTAKAAATAVSWPADVKLAVNLSPIQIKAPGAALGILSALKDAGLDPRRLVLEVTESLFLEDDDNTSRFMKDLSTKGVRFALDDFGTGYSALHYINKYPFRKIKVDRSFVSGPSHGPRSDAIIRAVAEMGATLDMEIVAEGLETIEQVQFARNAGCTLGQGYFFSRAVPDYLAAILLSEEEERDGVRRKAG